MAASFPFEPWLEGRLEALGLDGDLYGGYIRGVLQEAECDAERLEGLAGVLAAGEPIQAITNIIEKQAQIVVKPKEALKEEDTLQKAALLAHEVDVHEDLGAVAITIASEKSLFKNTNLEDVMNARKLETELLRDESQRKKGQNKLQREKDKLTKQKRKEKEKKRTHKGERKR